MTCFIPGCTAPLWITQAWRNGPTIHTCKQHEPLLPKTRAEAEGRTPMQGVLL